MKIYDKKQGHAILCVRTMGKILDVTAIYSTDKEANAHMEKPSNNDAVVACWGPLVVLADVYDKGVKYANA